ncbi:hypothetical protein [Desulfogranum japonicum]|uniref:hypothetical protein n=1 Tax=Desulfogranum japonicum TaxID=231447 RepID=UPI00040D5AD2|nr:hypothetical protein [Desulfogranum japonicum]
MTLTRQKIYDLLPAIHRLRDSEQGEPLKALLSVIASQVELLQENLDQLYDDQFIETCADWAVPYIGDLIGYQALHGIVPDVSSPRAEVANTISYRRRKGTASMLEQLAQDVTGWDSRVVEFFQLLATTQFMNHVRLNNQSLISLKQWEPLGNIGTPFDSMAHLVDVRRISNGRGKYNIPNIGIFLWRLQAYPLTDSPAAKLNDDVDDHRYLFHPLGMDMALFSKPVREREISHIAERINVPMAISRRVLSEYLDEYYGREKSFSITRDGTLVSPDQITVCNLSDAGSGAWAHQPPEEDEIQGIEARVAVDPVLGRIAFPQSLKPEGSVKVSFHYGFSAEVGGGEYERADTLALQAVEQSSVIQVPGDFPTLLQAFEEAANLYGQGEKNVIIEMTDSGRYEETLVSTLLEKQRIELRAANGCRPTIVLQEAWDINGKKESELVLNGLLVCGGTLQLSGDRTRLTLNHCTLVPGLLVCADGEPLEPDKASLVGDLSADSTITIRHCITGALLVKDGQVVIENSIVDATYSSRVAFAGLDGETPGAAMDTLNATIIGKVHATTIGLATNTVFWCHLNETDTWPAPIWIERRQIGCIRFSFLPHDSQVPRRYHCQPDLEIAQQIEEKEKTLQRQLYDYEIQDITEHTCVWLLPRFTTLRYGMGGYAQLRSNCPLHIRQGADDESEMGVFHDLYQPQREINLRTRLDEYLRFGLEAGIFYVS